MPVSRDSVFVPAGRQRWLATHPEVRLTIPVRRRAAHKTCHILALQLNRRTKHTLIKRIRMLRIPRSHILRIRRQRQQIDHLENRIARARRRNHHPHRNAHITVIRSLEPDIKEVIARRCVARRLNIQGHRQLVAHRNLRRQRRHSKRRPRRRWQLRPAINPHKGQLHIPKRHQPDTLDPEGLRLRSSRIHPGVDHIRRERGRCSRRRQSILNNQRSPSTSVLVTHQPQPETARRRSSAVTNECKWQRGALSAPKRCPGIQR